MHSGGGMENRSEHLKGNCIDKWYVDYEKWNKLEFAENVSEYLANNFPESHAIDQHLIAMLSITMDTYVACQLAIRKEGLIIADANGNPIGQSPYVKIMHTQFSLIKKLRKELKLLPKDRLRNE